MTKKITTVDLFCGIGGIRRGFEKAGFQTVFSNDFDADCKITYDLNFDDPKLTLKDIRELDVDKIPDFDLLLGGFPCQPFSIAGYQQGFNDEKGRGNLFFSITDILKAKKPKGFLLENVRNLETHDEGNTFKAITNMLESKDLGYHIKYKVMNSSEYGNVPQCRERIYIVGFLNEETTKAFRFPDETDLTVSIKDFLENNVDKKYYYNDKPLYEKIKDHVTKTNTAYQWRRIYVRENKSNVCPTLTANMGMGGHNVPIIKDRKGIRKLTPRECFNLQGFPKDFKLPKIADSHLYKQAGNSVTVPIIEKIAFGMKTAMLCTERNEVRQKEAGNLNLQPAPNLAFSE